MLTTEVSPNLTVQQSCSMPLTSYGTCSGPAPGVTDITPSISTLRSSDGLSSHFIATEKGERGADKKWVGSLFLTGRSPRLMTRAAVCAVSAAGQASGLRDRTARRLSRA